MRCGQVDVLSTDLGRLRDAYRRIGPTGLANQLFSYRPRAESDRPTLDKSDVLLTANVLGGNCSSIVVDWSWADGTGREVDLDLDLDPNREFAERVRGVSHRGGIRNATGFESGDVVGEATEVVRPRVGLRQSEHRRRFGGPLLLGNGNFYGSPVRFHAPIAYDPDNPIFAGGLRRRPRSVPVRARCPSRSRRSRRTTSAWSSSSRCPDSGGTERCSGSTARSRHVRDGEGRR